MFLFELFLAVPASKQSLDTEMAATSKAEDCDLNCEADDQEADAKPNEAEDARLLSVHRATFPKGYVGE